MRLSKEPLVNPVVIIIPTFFVPMLAATLRLSGLQSNAWMYETYVVLIFSGLAWLTLPSLYFLGRAFRSRSSLNRNQVIQSKIDFAFGSRSATTVVRLAWCIVVGSYALGNLIQGGQLFITNPELLFNLHYDFPFGLRFFARATPAIVVLLYLLYRTKRSTLDAILLAIAFIMPLSRGSRIDVAMSLVCLGCAFIRLPLFELTARRVALLTVVLTLLLAAGVEYGNQRLNRFGMYSVSYDDVIGWRSSITGPSMLFPTVYAYFPLSFENFDQLVRQGLGGRTGGLLSLDWLYTGFIKANWIPGYAELLSHAAFTPVSAGANVPTALMPFYSDFGAYFSFIPMTLVMMFWLYAYHRSEESLPWYGVFLVYTAAFSLSSFQGLIVAPIISQQMVEIALVLTYLAHRARREIPRVDVVGVRG